MMDRKGFINQIFRHLVIMTLTAKVVMLCLSLSSANTIAKEWVTPDSVVIFDLYAQPLTTTSIEPTVTTTGFNHKPLDVKQRTPFAEMLTTPRTTPQYFPVPKICSHTGIFLCLRL